MTVTLAPIRHFKGARQPPIFSTLSSDDPAFDPLPASATADFSMRLVNSATLKVNHAAAVITSEPSNTLRYDWQAADVDTAGFYVGWFRVTLPGGQWTETPEFLISIVDHVAESAYVTYEELKNSASIRGDYADEDITEACVAASRAIDGRLERSFVLGSAGESRTYQTNASTWVEIDDLSTLTSVTVDGVLAVQGTDYQTVAGAVGWPITTLEALGGYVFPTRKRVITVVGTYGWPSVPANIKAATKIVAARVLTRARAAPFGVLGLGFEGTAVHVARFDPDLDMLLAPYERSGGSLAQ